jgi:putative component of toxin-antitoxin plasmid stabilization module
MIDSPVVVSKMTVPFDNLFRIYINRHNSVLLLVCVGGD